MPIDFQVKLLLRVHHRNLTSLLGYCNEEDNVGLIYEYMANGNLYDYLSGMLAPLKIQLNNSLKVRPKKQQL